MSQHLGKAFGLLVALVVLPFAAIALVFLPVLRLVAFLHWQVKFGRKGIRALAVYSDSPKWKQHFEQDVLPLLEGRVHVVNATSDSSWKNSRGIARRVHRWWGGRQNHTPVVIWFPASAGRVIVIRFYQAYGRAAHHDNDRTELENAVSCTKSLVHAGA